MLFVVETISCVNWSCNPAGFNSTFEPLSVNSLALGLPHVTHATQYSGHLHVQPYCSTNILYWLKKTHTSSRPAQTVFPLLPYADTTCLVLQCTLPSLYATCRGPNGCPEAPKKTPRCFQILVIYEQRFQFHLLRNFKKEAEITLLTFPLSCKLHLWLRCESLSTLRRDFGVNLLYKKSKNIILIVNIFWGLCKCRPVYGRGLLNLTTLLTDNIYTKRF